MVHISILISFLSLAGISNIIHRMISKEFELTYYFACLFCVFVLYFGGLLNVLEPAVIGLRVIGLCGCLLFLNKSFRSEFKITYGVVFIITSILFLYWNINTINYAYYSGVDDYAHWGRMMMQITNKNSLIEANDNFATGNASNYPPAIALFQYIFTYFTGYERNIGTFGQGLLTLSAFSVLCLSIRQKFDQKHLVLFSVLVLFIGSMVWIFGSGLHSLQADLLMGTTMGIALFIYYFYKKEGSVNAVLLAAPAILSLVIIKHIGILFAGFTLAVIVADVYSTNRKNFFRCFIYILGILIALLALRYTWTCHVSNSGLAISHSPRVTTFLDVVKAFIPVYMTDFQKDVINNYVHYLFLSHHTSTYWFFATLILTFTSFRIAKSNSIEIPKLACACFYLCFAAYLFVMLLLYLFAFSESEGIAIASATRYIKTMSLAMLIFFAGIVFILLDKTILNVKNKILTFVTFSILILPNLGRIFIDSYASFMNFPTQTEAYEIEKMAEYAVSRTPENSKIYFVWIDLSGDNSVFFRYGIFPRESNHDCSSIKPIGALKSKDDPSPCFMTAEQFEKIISNYDYIYLASTTDEFKQNYFVKLNTMDEPNGLFEIRIKDDQLRLLKK